MSELVVAVMDEDGQEVELAFPASFFGHNYQTVVRRYEADGACVQIDIARGLDLFGAAIQRENLVATYKADGYVWEGDLVWRKAGVPGWVAIYIRAEER